MTKEQAEERGKALVDRLNQYFDEHWKVRVWENMGWHYSAVCGSMSVHYNSNNGKYTCYVDEKIPGSGSLSAWFDNEDADPKPETAVRQALDRAKTYIAELRVIIQENEKLLNPNYNPATPGK